jgi:hypothetical protein
MPQQSSVAAFFIFMRDEISRGAVTTATDGANQNTVILSRFCEGSAFRQPWRISKPLAKAPRDDSE